MKKIKLSASQIVVLFVLSTVYNLYSLEEQLEKIKQKYPDGIPDDCQEEFELQIFTDEAEEILGIFEDATRDNDLQENWERLIALKNELQSLLDAAEELPLPDHSCRLVILMGGATLSTELVKKLAVKKIEVVAIQNKKEIETIIADKIKSDSRAEFNFLLILGKTTDPNVADEVYDFLAENTLEGVYVYYLSDDGEENSPKIADENISSEIQIDWEHAIGIELEEPEDSGSERK